MRVVALVPMKLNNRRLPQKNVKCFTNGKPLCTYVLSTLINISEIDEVYVYCSDEGITDFLPKGVKYLKRDKRFDLDTTSIVEMLQTFSEKVESDIYVLAHVTAPFISAESIQTGIHAVKEAGYDSAFSVHKVQDFIWSDGKPFNYSLNRIPRTQDLPILYMETTGFYIFKGSVINELGRRIGTNPYMVEVGAIEALDIDELEDFVIADAINYYKKNV